MKGLESCFWRDVRTVVIGRRQPNGAPLSFFSGRWSVVSGKWLVVNSGGHGNRTEDGMACLGWVERVFGALHFSTVAVVVLVIVILHCSLFIVHCRYPRVALIDITVSLVIPRQLRSGTPVMKRAVCVCVCSACALVSPPLLSTLLHAAAIGPPVRILPMPADGYLFVYGLTILSK